MPYKRQKFARDLTLEERVAAIEEQLRRMRAINQYAVVGYLQGMQITIKDSSNVYIWGGQVEICGAVFNLKTQLSFTTGTLDPDTLYYLYVTYASSNTLSLSDFFLSTTAPTYNHELGSYYYPGNSYSRWLANIKTAA
jgi:hypothetical protein